MQLKQKDAMRKLMHGGDRGTHLVWDGGSPSALQRTSTPAATQGGWGMGARLLAAAGLLLSLSPPRLPTHPLPPPSARDPGAPRLQAAAIAGGAEAAQPAAKKTAGTMNPSPAQQSKPLRPSPALQ